MEATIWAARAVPAAVAALLRAAESEDADVPPVLPSSLFFLVAAGGTTGLFARAAGRNIVQWRRHGRIV